MSKFRLWDTVSYGHMEELMPFIMILEHDKLQEVYSEYIKQNEINPGMCFVITDEENNIVIDGRQFIYESPDNGVTIYRRKFGIHSDRELINIK